MNRLLVQTDSVESLKNHSIFILTIFILNKIIVAL